ncbi:hypothetical protein SKAU_G00046190 [Synaphobranchus kaupii]|uniref:Uncharacterized protein n=1 Tax=Synaphobranchus kaupii TaxID=118154 RepID=A0A9Q1J749_SYNKA|nr:hypothetical protein SKAU_G00046190 [Synaphobranchus kaupii]
MEAVEKQNSEEELSDVTKAEDDTAQSSEGAADNSKEDQDRQSQEFHLRAVAFRCDLVSLEDRLQHEERSRDQAEKYVEDEVSSCQSLLLTLLPLCEQKQKTTELIQQLQKALDVLPLAMTRMSIRSETLGTIKEEKRVTQDVEAMIQHVEKLRGIYSTEHTELTELKESLEEEEKPSPEKDDISGQQAPGPQYYSLWGQGEAEVDLDGLNRRSTWRGAGRNVTQPALHRLINSSAWMMFNEASLMSRYEDTDLPPVEEKEVDVNEKTSSLTKLGNKLTAFVRAIKTRDHPVLRMVRSFPAMVRDRSSWEWWTPLVLAVLLGSLLALLGTLTLQPAV